MLRKCAAVLAVVLCLANVNAPRAEPGPMVRWLINKPASLFDIGMLLSRLDLEELKDYEELQDRGGHLLFFPRYDWDKNRIYLMGSIFDASPETDGKLFCKLLISKVRKIGGVLDDGKVFGNSHSGFAANFGHIGYTAKDEPDDYLRKLDHIIEVEGYVDIEGSSAAIRCHGPLVSNKVYFEE